MNAGDEDDRSFLKARVLTNHVGQFESVEIGHADIHQHNSNIMSSTGCSSASLRGSGLDEVLAQIRRE